MTRITLISGDQCGSVLINGENGFAVAGHEQFLPNKLIRSKISAGFRGVGQDSGDPTAIPLRSSIHDLFMMKHLE